MKWHLVFWILLLTALVVFGWYKNRENEADIAHWNAWHDRVTQLGAEVEAEEQRISNFLFELHFQPDAKQQVEEFLNDGAPFELKPQGEKEVATWTHPEYGFQVIISFEGDELGTCGVGSGYAWVRAQNPEPGRPSLTSSAEWIRQSVIKYEGLWPWLAALVISIISRRFGLLASEVMVAVPLLLGTANLLWPVSIPGTQRLGLNGPQFYSTAMFAVMYLLGLPFLAYRLAQRGFRPRFRFGIRTILLVTTVAAVLFALRPAGLVALSVVGISAPPFLLLCHLFANRVDYLRSHATRLELERTMRTAHRMSR